MSSWVIRMVSGLQRTAADEEGQTMAEYGLILAGIAVVVMVAVVALGGQLTATFNGVIASLTTP